MRSTKGLTQHEVAARVAVARSLAALKGFEFGGGYDSSLQRSERPPLYFVPSETLSGEEAARLGIRGADDLFGGVVPYPFVGTKTIVHPLASRDGAAARRAGRKAFAAARARRGAAGLHRLHARRCAEGRAAAARGRPGAPEARPRHRRQGAVGGEGRDRGWRRRSKRSSRRSSRAAAWCSSRAWTRRRPTASARCASTACAPRTAARRKRPPTTTGSPRTAARTWSSCAGITQRSKNSS